MGDLGREEDSRSDWVGASWEWETWGGQTTCRTPHVRPGMGGFVGELPELNLFSPRFQVNIEGSDLEAG